MSQPKSRLGRGLGALIASGSTPAKAAAHSPAHAPATPASKLVGPPPASGYVEIPVASIDTNPHQPRREFPEDQMKELSESIRSEGLLQPVVVRRLGDRYQLVAGERRWRAFQLLRLKNIPARLIQASDVSSAALSLIENLQREGLNPVEEAMGYASLIRDFDLTQEQAAERVGRSRALVANSLRLLQLDKEIQGYLAHGQISTGHAKVLLALAESAVRIVAARRIIEQGLSVRAAEKLVESLKRGGGVPAAPRAMQPAEQAAVADVAKRLTSHLNARVSLKHSAKRGKIVIEYQGNADLQRILEKLGLKL